MNRREFLAAGTATALTMSARSYARVPGANSRMGLGVIGLGRRGSAVAAAFTRDPRVDIVAISDVYGVQTEHFRKTVLNTRTQPPAFVNHHELLAHKDVDSVLISTPDHLHVTMAKDAITAKKNLYMEKPTFHKWEERTELERAKAASNVVLQCGMQQRSGAHYMRAKQEFVGGGKLGKVVLVRGVWHNFPWQDRHIANEPKPADLNWDLFLGPAPKVPYRTDRYSSWRYFPDYGHGLLADIMTHWVDVAQWLMDDAHPLSAASVGGIYDVQDGRENPDTVSATLGYRNWNFNFESTVLPVHNKRTSVLFEGSEGTLDISRNGFVFTPNSGQPVTVQAEDRLDQAHTGNFVDAVLDGKPVNAPLNAGVEATLPVQMALRSYWTRKMVTSSEMV